VVDTARHVVKFSQAGVSFVGGRMLGKSATGPTYLPALHTDPGAARGGRHGGEVGSEGGEEMGSEGGEFEERDMYEA
jgi:hypothetical protein